MESASDRLDQRRRTHDALSARLAALSDDDLLAQTASWPVNVHGNQAGIIELDGAKVFVKTISLTDLERASENEGSTANLFGLPLFYQYGVGSSGFGAQRELQATLRASDWAFSGACPHFPLVYHWRVLPRTAPSAFVKQPPLLQLMVDRWEGSEAVRARLTAISAASQSILLCLEYVPEMVRTWLTTKWPSGRPDTAVEASILRIHDQWRDTAAFLTDRGMQHFDLHRQNVLFDGAQIYAADFGLALCADFALSPAERAFLETHRLYDKCYVPWSFTAWLAPTEDEPRILTPALQALVDHCAPVAGIFGNFIKTLGEASKTTPYPQADLEAAFAAQSP